MASLAVSNTQIHFSNDAQGGLFVTIETERLQMQSIQVEDTEHYVALFGDEKVMEKFASGVPQPRSDIEKRIATVWTSRWRNHDPYTGFAVFKKDTKDFVGHAVLGHGNCAGESEMAYLFKAEYWNQGYGTESMTALVHRYALATLDKGYTLEEKPLEKITATVRLDNVYSEKILNKLGMHLTGKKEEYGAMRHSYAISVEEIRKQALDSQT